MKKTEKGSSATNKAEPSAKAAQTADGKTAPAQARAASAASKERPLSFAHGLNFYKLFWIFFISCFAGVVIELAYCFATQGHFESRSGLVYGPFNLVYGFGGLFMTMGLAWLSDKRDIYIFLGGFAIGSVVEYACSWVQQAMFGTVSWEYSNLPLNLNGRISLLYSFFWGLLALVWIKTVYPSLSKVIEKIPNAIGKWLTWILLVFMIFNTVMSGLALYRMSERHDGVPATNAVQVFFDEHFPDARLKAVYANMNFVDENGLSDIVSPPPQAPGS